MTSQDFGMVIGAGGADVIIKAMTGLLRAKGGELFLNAPVASVDIVSGRARTVTLADGRKLTAKRAVISNIHPQLLFNGMVPQSTVPRRFVEGLTTYRAGPGAMMIHLTLDGLPDWSASPS
jgi:phytoene dehydrogenase-like protein